MIKQQLKNVVLKNKGLVMPDGMFKSLDKDRQSKLKITVETCLECGCEDNKSGLSILRDGICLDCIYGANTY